MSIQNSVVKTGSTAITATGGTNVTLKSLGDTTSRHEVWFGGASFAEKSYVSFAASAPKVSSDSPSGYTQERNSLVLKVPKDLGDEGVVINTVRVSAGFDVNTTEAEKMDMVYLTAQILGLSDFEDFWSSRTMS